VPELKPHLDDFTLLRYTAGDLDDVERFEVGRHLETCSDCSGLLGQMSRLDVELAAIATKRDAFLSEEILKLPPGDPFRSRPEIAAAHRRAFPGSERIVETAVVASQQAMEAKERLLEAVGDSKRMRSLLASLSFADPTNRYSLLYALQEGGRRIAESPAHSRRFAEEALDWVRGRDGVEGLVNGPAERMVPWLLLLGQAHQLAGQACNWMGEYEMAKTHFQLAYSSFARSGDEVSLAVVEQLESQRRFFVGLGEEALVLARRAAGTFEEFGLEDSLARARGSEGMALLRLGRPEEALKAYYEALAVFESRALWSNYVGIVNNIAVCLVKLGRLGEARREYARALRHLSRNEHRSLLAFIREGLAEVLFAAERYRQAARALAEARRLFVESGLRANALTTWLFEAESWARAGDLALARQTLAAFQSHLAADRSLDITVARGVEKALTGLDPELRNIAELRQQAEAFLPPSSRGLSA
jgi:tetratricopeptide (TPR) repeat protein